MHFYRMEAGTQLVPLYAGRRRNEPVRLARPIGVGFPGHWLDGSALWNDYLAGVLKTQKGGHRSAGYADFVKMLV